MAYNYITPEERRKAEREARALSSPRYGLEEYAQKPVQSMTEPQQERAGVGERALHTVGDLFGNVISGAAKGLEGIYDLGASAVGAVGGVFDKGFQERVKQHVAYDFTGEHVAKPLDRMTEHSYLNEGKVGSFIENVASGVGQMLPAVAVSLATGGIGGAVGLAPSAVTKAAQAASLGTLTASAAGSGTEEAFSDGADYGKGMAYGMATGAVEGLTEKIWGGFGGLTGKGVLDGLGKGVAKTGLARVAKEAVQEGTEEAIASVASPGLKSIYKGRDAFSEYGEGGFWRGVGESALVGAGTSVAYGGTVGYLNKTSGKRADVREVLDEIGELERERAALFAEGELTPGSDADVKTARGIDANYRLLERVLKRAKPAVREDIIKGNGLSDRFNDDGSLRAEFLSASRDLPSGEQTEGQKENAPTGQNFASQARYMSPSLWRARGRVDADLASLTEQRRGVPGQENAAALRLFDGELSENGAAAYSDAKRAWNALSTKTGGTMQLAVIDGDERVRGARRGSTVYISKAALEDGRWADTLLEEATHFTQGSREHFALGKFLAGQTDIMDEVRAELSEEGNPYGFTEEDAKALREGRSREFGNEMVAHAAAKILDTPRYVERLVRADRTLAEKIRNRVENVKAALESLGSRASRRAYNRLQRTAQLFENALEGGGQIVAGRIEKGEKEQSDYGLNGHFEEEGVDKYTEKQYNDFGWARAEGILSAGQMRDFTEKFAAAKTNQGKFPTTKSGEYMIAVSDIYGESEGVNNVIVYVSGDMDSPKISRVLEIDLDNETEIDRKRREIYVFERRGIQPPIRGIFRFHTPADGGYLRYEQGKGIKNVGDNNQLGLQRGRGRAASDRIKEFKVNDDGTYTYTYADGRTEIVTGKKRNSRGEKGDFSLENVNESLENVTEGAGNVTEGAGNVTEGAGNVTKEANQQTSGDLEGETTAEPTSEKKKKSKTKAEVVADNARLREEKRAAKRELQEEQFRTKLAQEIQRIVKEIQERKEGYFRAGSTRRSAEVLEFVDKLSQINYSRMLTGSVRNIFRGFRDWFTPQNEALSEWFENEEHAETGRDIMDMLAALSEGEGDENTPLTLDEMRMVRNVVSFFNHLEDGWHKVRRGDQFVDALPIANEYQGKMLRARQNRSFIVSGLLNRIWGSDKKKRGAIARYVMEFGDPMMIARLFDSYDKQGFWTETMEEWREAGIRMDVQRMDMLRSYKEFFEGRKGIEKRLAKEKITYRGREMSLDIAASLYMTMKRKQAQRGLVESYYTFFAENGDKLDTDGFSPRATYEQGKLEDAEIAKICYEQRAALWEMFDEETRDYISMLEKIYEETRQVRRDAELKNKGFSYIEEEGGYYYPIKRDQVAQSIARTGAHGDRVGHQSTDQHVVKGANAGLVILPASAVLLDHVNQTVLEANFHAARENFNVLVNLDIGENAKNAKTIKRAAETHDDTSEMYKYMQQLARDIQGINDTRRSAFDELFRVIRSNYAIFQLGANPKTIAVQTSAMIAATDVLDVSNVLQTAHKGFVPASAAEVDKYCRLAELRNSENSAALAQGVLEKTGRLGSVLMKGIGWMDRRMICSLFEACRVQVEKDSKGKYKVGSEENGIRAGELLQRVILETQQNSLVTERSAMMRNKGNILNLFTMFSADAMKLCGRLVDAMGEYSVIYKQYRAANAADAKALKGQLDAAGKQLCKSVSVSVVSAIFTALIAQAFRWLYAKDDDKEPGEIAKQMAVDALGNTMGGLPIVRDIYSALMQGYDMDIFMLTTANDLLDAVSGTFSIAGDIFSGKEVTEQEIARNIRGTLYAGGAVLGIPVRNLYNTGAGLVSRVSRQAKYAIDGFFYEHNYTADLAAAIEAEDDKMVETIADLITDGSVGSLDKQTREVLRRLVGAGYDVLPRTLADSITYEGEKIALTRAQKKRFRTVYDVADEAVADLVRRKSFKETDEKTQAKAIKFIYNTYYGLACDDVLGVDSTQKSVLFAEAIEVDKLALIATQARSLEADFGPDGKAISGSRRKKVERFVESLALTAAQKYMIMGYLGYKNKNGREIVERHIRTLGLSKAEQAELLEMSGYKE